jgi:hypothetical protein
VSLDHFSRYTSLTTKLRYNLVPATRVNGGGDQRIAFEVYRTYLNAALPHLHTLMSPLVSPIPVNTSHAAPIKPRSVRHLGNQAILPFLKFSRLLPLLIHILPSIDCIRDTDGRNTDTEQIHPHRFAFHTLGAFLAETAIANRFAALL